MLHVNDPLFPICVKNMSFNSKTNRSDFQTNIFSEFKQVSVSSLYCFLRLHHSTVICKGISLIVAFTLSCNSFSLVQPWKHEFSLLPARHRASNMSALDLDCLKNCWVGSKFWHLISNPSLASLNAIYLLSLQIKSNEKSSHWLYSKQASIAAGVASIYSDNTCASRELQCLRSAVVSTLHQMRKICCK